ncbi:cytochrome c oxidase assembly protein [Streptomyces mayteni]
MTTDGTRVARRSARWAAGGVAVAGAALVGSVRFGGGIPESLPGLADAGQVTAWGLPLARGVADGAAVATLAPLLLVTVLAGPGPERLGARALRAPLFAAGAAAVWLLACLAGVVLTASDLLGRPVGELTDPAVLVDVALNAPAARASALSGLAALLLATFLPAVTRVTGARIAVLVALAGLLPPAWAGHAASSGNHDTAVLGLAVHIVAATVWVAGLLAVVGTALWSRPWAADAAERFGRLAAWCLPAVALSGLAGAWVRLDGLGQLFSTRYGLLLVAKAVALAALAACGAAHRRRALPALRAGRGVAFVRLATVELLVMAAAVGLAVGLSRSPTPAGAPLPYSPARELLGFPMPEPLGDFPWTPLFTQWRLDPVFALAVGLAAVAYAIGVRRLRARGDRWPVGRTVSWFLGLAVVVAATMSGLAEYGRVLFSVHMGQHMVLAMTAPILLVLGAPVTLALRALPSTGRAGRRGPREWLLALVHSRYLRVVSHPVVSGTLFVGSAFAVYYTPLFGMLMRSHYGHTAMLAHFLLVGALFFWVIIGVDPGPRRPPYLARLITLIITMPFHSWFAISLMSSSDLLGRDWWEAVARPWGASPADDQYAAGAIAWATGDIPILVTLVALSFQWVRSDFREARRVDRAIARGGAADPLAAYNAYLARLHGHAPDTVAAVERAPVPGSSPPGDDREGHPR